MARSNSQELAISDAAADTPPLARPSVVRGVLASLRPHQWTKNLFVFAALIFAQRLFDLRAVATATAAFVVLLRAVGCRVPGERYCRPQYRPAAPTQEGPADRVGHGFRRSRRRRGRDALAAAALTAAFPSTGVSALSRQPTSDLMLLYSGPLKHIVILDVLTVSIGFVLRAAAGADRARRRLQPLVAGLHHAAGAVHFAGEEAARTGPARGRRAQLTGRYSASTPRTCSTR